MRLRYSCRQSLLLSTLGSNCLLRCGCFLPATLPKLRSMRSMLVLSFRCLVQPVFKLHPLRNLANRLKIWELICADHGFWSYGEYIPSLPIGPLSWSWLLRRICDIRFFKPMLLERRCLASRELRVYHLRIAEAALFGQCMH